jgi:glycine cleavage system H protein
MRRVSLGVFQFAFVRQFATRMFTDTHEWVQMNGDGTATMGITDNAQKSLGDIVYVGLPEVGQRFDRKATIGDVESVKATSDIYSPVSGEVVEVNVELKDNPKLLNDSAEEKGWLVKLKNVEPASGLLSAEEYKKFVDEHHH